MKAVSLLPVGWRGSWIVILAALAALTLSRWSTAPKYLLRFDTVNFALALDEFNPARHQPQPPGYPFFVALTKALHWFVPKVEHVFVLSGILGGMLTILLLCLLGERMFSSGAGTIAALLLVFHPVFWLSGITNQVRIFLAAGGTAVALTAWHAWQPGSPRKWFYASALLLGVAAGFRPDMLLFLPLLLLAVGIRSRRTLLDFALSGFLLALGISSWFSIVVVKVGGPSAFCRVLAGYMHDQFHSSSVLYGATLQSALRMAQSAVVWTALGAISWIWAVPLAWKRLARGDGKARAIFLALWFLPAFLFHIFVHVGDPDHTLITAPVLCLVGGWVLSCIRPSSHGNPAGRYFWVLGVAVAVALNVLLFFHPLPGPDLRASYEVVRDDDRGTVSTLEALQQVRAAGPIFLVSYNSFPSWRHLSYYFPDDPLLVLHGNLETQADPPEGWLIRHRKFQGETVGREVLLPVCGKIVWLIPPNPSFWSTLDRKVLVTHSGRLAYFDARPGMQFRLGAYHFATSATSGSRRPEAGGDAAFRTQAFHRRSANAEVSCQ